MFDEIDYCETCEHCDCEPHCEPCVSCKTKYDGPPTKHSAKQRTNADRIRAMSDEELAKWLVEKTVYQESAFSQPSYLNYLTGSDDTMKSAIKGTAEWLKQPAEE